MKYRIKNIRREGWVETEENLFRPSEDVTPVTPVDTEDIAESGEPEIYIIADEGSAADDSTVVYTPAPEEKPKEKASPFAFLKTKEGKVIAILVGAFAFILILFTVVVIALTSDGKGTGGNTEPPATDHVHAFETIVITKSTCTEKGMEREKCSVCGYTTGEESVDALGHKWKRVEAVSVDATCETGGKLTERCERCDETQITTLDPLGHDWEKLGGEQPTCENAGWSENKCKRCGTVESADIPAKGHSWIQLSETESTCEKEGEITLKCANCKVVKTEVTAKKEHELINPVRVEPTCNKEGTETAVCKVCSREIVTTLDKLPHDLTEATCEEGQKCKTCGETVGEGLGHKFENGVCTVCNKSQAYDNTAHIISVGQNMQIATGLNMSADSCTLEAGKVTLSFTLSVSNGFTGMYGITPELIYITDPDGNRFDRNLMTITGAIFNLPSSGSVKCSTTIESDKAGIYTLYIVGEGGIQHAAMFTIEPTATE